jgi:hypothetical protein
MFLAHHKTVINQPQFTTNPPHLHHKNTTKTPQKKRTISKTPLKTPIKSTKKAPATAGTFFLQIKN